MARINTAAARQSGTPGFMRRKELGVEIEEK
jgi:hypothetical protein